jgi:hypothetical protein
MRPVAYTLQFRGRALLVSAGVVRFSLSAPGASLATTLVPDGLQTTYDDVPGHEATFDATLSIRGDATFDDVGTIEFSPGHRLHVRSLTPGRLVPCPDPNLRHGAVVRRIVGGQGQFADAEGFVTSSLLVSDTGEVTDHQLGLVFIHARRPMARPKGAP